MLSMQGNHGNQVHIGHMTCQRTHFCSDTVHCLGHTGEWHFLPRCSCKAEESASHGCHTSTFSLITCVCICMCFCVYLAACVWVVTPVTCLTPVTAVSLRVGRADALSILRVAVSTSVFTGACWERSTPQPVRDGKVKTSQQLFQIMFSVDLPLQPLPWNP